MTNFGCNEILMLGLSFTIQGQEYHHIGSLCPPTLTTIQDFATFRVKRASQVTTRCNVVDGLIPEIVQNVSQMLSHNNHNVVYWLTNISPATITNS